jgi:sugar (pentulose or hexulose) kinase
MQLRADVSGRVYHRPEFPESAFGSAILAAAATCQDDLSLACRRMVHLERSFHPDPARTDLYTEYYDRFLALLGQRGLLQEPSP